MRDTNGKARSDPPVARRLSPGWAMNLAIFSLGSVALIWLFRSEIGAAVRVWRDSETFGHAFFIFPIILFLFFRLRDRLAAVPPIATPWVLVPIAVLMLVWLLGRLATLTIVQQLAFVAVWQCFFLLVFGWSVTSRAIFPLAYLYMAVPFGLSVIPLLQDITAQIVVRLLRITGVPVFLDGYHIEIPDGSFLVAEACSGVRYLIVCTALGMLAAYLFFNSWKRRILFVGLSVAVPIIANGIRAYGIVMIAHLSHYTVAVDVDHVVYGFIFLSLVTVCLLGLGAFLRDRGVQRSDRPDPVTCPAYDGGNKRILQVSSAAAAIAIVFSFQLWASIVERPPVDREVALGGVDAGQGWQHLEGEHAQWTPDFRGMDAELQRRFLGPEGSGVELYVAYYEYQREGAEAVSDLNAVSREGSEWKLLGARRTNLAASGRVLPINQAVLGRQDQTILVWYWYWIDGTVTDSRLQGKLLEARALLTGGDRDAAIVAVSTKVTDNIEGAASLLHRFLQSSVEGGRMVLQVSSKPEQSGLGDGGPRRLNLVGGSLAP
jgi:exosortase A